MRLQLLSRITQRFNAITASRANPLSPVRPWSELWALLGWVALAIGLVWAGHHRFAPLGQGLPSGCDEFGYLNMAKSLHEGELFGDHAARPFAEELIQDLKAAFPDPNWFRWVIAPHAYHLGPTDEKIINQYPPGVGLLLAPVPLHLRRVLFPALCIALGIVFVAFAARVDAGKWSFSAMAITGLLSLALIAFEGVNIEFRRVNSLAPTMGLLVAAGWMLPRHPLLSLGLLSATTVFRLPNVLMAVPLGLAYLAFEWPRARTAWANDFLTKSLKAGVVFLLSGFGLYLLYAWLLLGNPLLPTYSAFDQKFAGWEDLKTNLRFYFAEQNTWLFPHVLALALLALACTLARKWRWMLFGICVVAFNYIFYLFHQVHVPYYPYASALLLIGLAVGIWQGLTLPRRLRLVLPSLGVGVLLFLFSQIGRTEIPAKAHFDAEIERYNAEVGHYDVVWAEIHSGTIEYATNQAAFRYQWGSDVTRPFLMKWLGDHGYAQAIWLDDVGMPDRVEIEAALQQHNIPYALTTTATMGDFFDLYPKR